MAHEKQTNMKTYVFFNDGDSKDDKDKVSGSMGGIYVTHSTNLTVVRALMKKAMRKGSEGNGAPARSPSADEVGNDVPVWTSTSGLGVYWLHVRLDSRPKYYQHQPFKKWPSQ